MKLPIHLHIGGNTVWTTYREERDAVQDVAALKKFVSRWLEIYPLIYPSPCELPTKINVETLTEDTLQRVKTEQIGEDEIALNIVLPATIFKAMMLAKNYAVPLNTAFIQAHGGIEAFQE